MNLSQNIPYKWTEITPSVVTSISVVKTLIHDCIYVFKTTIRSGQLVGVCPYWANKQETAKPAAPQLSTIRRIFFTTMLLLVPLFADNDFFFKVDLTKLFFPLHCILQLCSIWKLNYYCYHIEKVLWCRVDSCCLLEDRTVWIQVLPRSSSWKSFFQRCSFTLQVSKCVFTPAVRH